MTLSLDTLRLSRSLRGEPLPPLGEKSCFNCAHLARWTESWEMPHIGGFECKARPANENLKSFPFRNTTCKHWKGEAKESRKETLTPSET